MTPLVRATAAAVTVPTDVATNVDLAATASDTKIDSPDVVRPTSTTNLTLVNPAAERHSSISQTVRDLELTEKSGLTADQLAFVGAHSKRRELERATSVMIAEWAGMVTKLESDHFVGELTGLHGTAVSGEKEEAFIPLSDVRDSDKHLLVEGGFFRLCVSYEISASGNRRRFTDVIFRRLPGYTRQALQEADDRAQRRTHAIRVE